MVLALKECSSDPFLPGYAGCQSFPGMLGDGLCATMEVSRGDFHHWRSVGGRDPAAPAPCVPFTGFAGAKTDGSARCNPNILLLPVLTTPPPPALVGFFLNADFLVSIVNVSVRPGTLPKFVRKGREELAVCRDGASIAPGNKDTRRCS